MATKPKVYTANGPASKREADELRMMLVEMVKVLPLKKMTRLDSGYVFETVNKIDNFLVDCGSQLKA